MTCTCYLTYRIHQNPISILQEIAFSSEVEPVLNIIWGIWGKIQNVWIGKAGEGERRGASKAVKVLISSNQPHHPTLTKVDSTRKTVFKIHSFKHLESGENLENRVPFKFNPTVRVGDNFLCSINYCYGALSIIKLAYVLTFQISWHSRLFTVPITNNNCDNKQQWQWQ